MDVAGRYPVELVEHLAEVFPGDADAVVGYGDPDFPVAGPGAEGEAGGILAVLDGVVHEVVQDIGQVEAVGQDSGLSDVDPAVQGAALALGLHRCAFDDALQHFPEGDMLLFEFEIAPFDLGQLQDLFHLVIQSLVLFPDDAGVAEQALILLYHRVGEEHIGRDLDCRDGGFELVGHVVDEILLQFRQPLLPQDHKHGIGKEKDNDQQDGRKEDRQLHLAEQIAGPGGELHAEIVGELVIFRQIAQLQVFLLSGRVAAVVAVDHLVGRAIIDGVFKVHVEGQALEFLLQEVLQAVGVDLALDVDDVVVGGAAVDDVSGRKLSVVEFHQATGHFVEGQVDLFVEFLLVDIPGTHHPVSLNADNADNGNSAQDHDPQDGAVFHIWLITASKLSG